MRRRSFVHQSAKVTLGLSAGILSQGSYAQRLEKIDRGKVGFAILGLGNFASYVAPRLKNCKHAKLAALISSDKQKAQAWANSFDIDSSNIYSYHDMDRIADNPSIAAVYVATPVGTHKNFAIKALNAGKHVLTEKTMASSVEEGEEMIEIAQANNRKLMVAYRARYEPFNQEAIKICRDESLGPLVAISAHKGFNIGNRFGKNNWRLNPRLSGGGTLLDIGIYSIQACRYLAGVEPLEAMAVANGKGGVEFDLSFILRFPEEVQAVGSASWNYGLQNYYRAAFSRGYVELDPATSNGNLRMKVKQENPREIRERFLSNVDQIVAEFDHFATCILEDRPPLTSGEEGLKDLKVIQAIYQSVREQRPIQV